MNLKNIQIKILGLGYVGLPLAVEFGKKYPTLGCDINEERISELTKGHDRTLELTKEQIEEAHLLCFSKDLSSDVLGSTEVKDVRGQMSDDGGQMSDFRGQKADERDQMSDDRGQISDEGGHMSDARNQMSDDRGQLSDIVKTTSNILSPTSNIQHPTSLAASNIQHLSSKTVTIFIVTVPTPIDKYKKPDLSPLISASKEVGKVINKGDIVIYESTVYPGCTEEDCIPVIEKESGLKYNIDFFAGYSPERINPGDKTHTVTKIKKVTSGSTPEIADFVNELYSNIIIAGTYKASSIKVAEAAKVIENCQRDINIAFVNELALIFDKMGIDTTDVLEAAGSKWNFLPFRPGLVGGHCIGVDPYYLTYKAESLGYNPQVILAGRRINDNMGKHVASELVKLLIKNNVTVKASKVLVCGITFKENCPDIRNSKVIDIIEELNDFGLYIDVLDPWADQEEVRNEYKIGLVKNVNLADYKGIVLAVGHSEFISNEMIEKLEVYKGVVYDVKSILPLNLISKRL